MKKSRLIFIAAFLFSIFIAKAQSNSQNNYRVDYLLTYVSDSTKINEINKEKFLLYVNGNKSEFLSENNVLKDSLKEKAKKDPEFAMSLIADLSQIPKSNFSFKIFKNINSEKIITVDKIVNDYYIYDESIKQNWELSQDTLTINGYKCKKATQKFKGRNYVAWFSPSIPITSGPYKFQNLPGLIIKISDVRKHYVFEMIGIKNEDFNFEIPNPKSSPFIKTNSKELEKTQKIASKNYFQRLEQNGITLNNAGKKLLGNRIQDKMTNPIELDNK